MPRAGFRTSATFRPAYRDDVIIRGQRQVLPGEFGVVFLPVCVSHCSVYELLSSALHQTLSEKRLCATTTGLFFYLLVYLLPSLYNVMCMLFLCCKGIQVFTYITVALPEWEIKQIRFSVVTLTLL